MAASPGVSRGVADRIAGFIPTMLEVGVPALLLLGLALFRLDAKSLWFDEVFSVQAAQSGIRGIARLAVGGEVNMALYYTALWPWLAIGSGDGWIRLLSVVFAVATVPIIYLIGRDIVGSRVGFLAALLFAASAFVVQYAQEARSYSMAMLFVALILFSALRALRDDNRVAWVVFVASSALAVYAHMFAALTVLAVGAVAFIAPRRPSDRRKMVVALLAVGALALPVELVIMLRQGGELTWVPPMSLDVMADAALTIAGTGTVSSRATPAAWALAVAMGGLVAWGMTPARSSDPEPRWGRLLLIAAVVIPIVLVVLVSVVKPIFVPRFFAMVVPPSIVLAAIALARLRLSVRVVAIGLVAVLAAEGLRTLYFARPKTDWRAASAYVVGEARPEDRLVVYEWWNRRPIEYYASVQVTDGSLPGVLSEGLRAQDPAAYAEALRRNLATVPIDGSIWLVLATSSGPAPELEDPRFAPLFEPYRIGAETRFDGLRIVRFDPRGA